MHTVLWHILLRQGDSYLFGAVVTVVEEEHYVTFANRCQWLAVTHMYDRFDELVRYIGIVARLHSRVHALELCALAVH